MTKAIKSPFWFNALAALTVFTMLALTAASGVRADDAIGTPQGRVLLTVSGSIETTNVGDTAQFDRVMLTEIGLKSFKTESPWYDTSVEFTGVPTAKLLDILGAQGTTVTAVALNDYQVQIPLEDLRTKGVILAMQADGERLSVRDKGPLFIIYPFSHNESLRNEAHFSRSVWQLKELRIH